MKLTYLSHYFKPDMVQALFTSNGEIQIITAPTGAGKSTFILENIIKIARGEYKPFGTTDKKCLILANRSSLLQQFKKDLEKNTNSIKEKEIITDYEVEFVNEYIEIITYQTLANQIMKDEEFLSKYKMIIADECHYFLNDSWNGTTQLVLTKLIEHNVANTVLFFSATTDEIKAFLDTLQKKNSSKNSYYKEVLPKEVASKLGLNHRLNITVTNDSLDNILSRIPKDEKFAIFVNEFLKKDNIEAMSNKYSNDDRLVGFLYSKWEQNGKSFKEDKIMKDRYNKTLEKEGFYEDEMFGLIANNSIDNGINFKDKSLKHIILLNQYDFVQIQQFIGRKRHDSEDETDRTNVYIICDEKKHLETVKNKSKKIINYYNDYNSLDKKEFMEKYLIQCNKNKVLIPAINKDSYLNGMSTFRKSGLNYTRDYDFPFLIVSDLQGKLKIYPDYCFIQKMKFKHRVVKKALDQVKEFTLARFFYNNLKKYYVNVNLVEIKKSKSQMKRAGKDEIPQFLNKIKGEQMNKDDYKKLREHFKTKWGIKHPTKYTTLGAKEFNNRISEYGYTIIDIPNKDRRKIYTVVKM